jgi:hypothetical protein
MDFIFTNEAFINEYIARIPTIDRIIIPAGFPGILCIRLTTSKIRRVEKSKKTIPIHIVPIKYRMYDMIPGRYVSKTLEISKDNVHTAKIILKAVPLERENNPKVL